ncbi:hypothetical protein RBH94_08370 [Aestuariibaculum sp. YM273]|uniref:hypothetical protein n=1 Tax=Aestuariibaculum sp. YM273 TaxID=3070659 RepID=UPI0027DE9188|nr:hypothetical protein [Aestuariibaculum sp. YM273]WMI64084.1 hypothetical protein RBH94_08370 [Aestuariibaculum sp. YM273]
MEAKINLRIDDEIKFRLEELAIENGQTLSEYSRDLLTDHVNEFYSDEEYPEEVVHLGTVTIDISEKFEKTFDFTYLVAWLFSKYMCPTEIDDRATVRTLKYYVEKVIDRSSFSLELKLEFVKVLNEINRFLVEPYCEDKKFQFASLDGSVSFDYNRLLDEIKSINK